MKRMAVIAVAIALSALPACAQRGGAHGGISGSHAGGGFSSPRGGFSGGHGGFSAPRAPSFHAGPGTPVRSGPLRFAGSSPGGFHPQPPPIRVPSRLGGPIQGPSLRPRQSVSSRIPYPGHGVPRVGPITSGPHRFDG